MPGPVRSMIRGLVSGGGSTQSVSGSPHWLYIAAIVVLLVVVAVLIMLTIREYYLLKKNKKRP